jgi:hypothetical protein
MAKIQTKKKTPFRFVPAAKMAKPPRRIPDNEEYMAGKFIGSKRKSKKVKIFHRLNCKWAVGYLNENNSYTFDHHEEAVAAGY